MSFEYVFQFTEMALFFTFIIFFASVLTASKLENNVVSNKLYMIPRCADLMIPFIKKCYMYSLTETRTLKHSYSVAFSVFKLYSSAFGFVDLT